MPVSPNLSGGSPLYYTGRKFRNALITSVQPTGNGLIKGTWFDLSLSQLIDSVEFEEELDLVEISAANAQMKNYVPTKADFTITVSEFMNSGGYASVLNMWKNGTYFLAEIAIEISADVLYGANGGPLGYAGAMADGTVIQCPFIAQGIRYGYSEGQEVAVLTGKPFGLPIYAVPPGGSLVY